MFLALPGTWPGAAEGRAARRTAHHTRSVLLFQLVIDSFDLWWMPQPLTRTYYRAGRADGGEVTLCRDQRQGRWSRQAP